MTVTGSVNFHEERMCTVVLYADCTRLRTFHDHRAVRSVERAGTAQHPKGV